MVRAQAGYPAFAEKVFCEKVESAFKLWNRDIFVNIKPFELVKHRRGGDIDLSSIGAGNVEHPDWRLGAFHFADLAVACVWCENLLTIFTVFFRFDEKSFPIVACRMVFWHV